MTMIWVLLGVAAVIVEMLTGTLYLLVVGVAAGLAALVSASGCGEAVQCLLAAVIAIAGSLLVSRMRKPSTGNMAPDLQGDAEVASQDTAGRLRVRWRGTEWEATADGVVTVGDAVVVVGQQGNVLRVKRLQN